MATAKICMNLSYEVCQDINTHCYNYIDSSNLMNHNSALFLYTKGVLNANKYTSMATTNIT